MTLERTCSCAPGVRAGAHRDGTSGGYLRRFSCRGCIFATDHDLRMIHEDGREAFDPVSELEQQSCFTMKAGRTLIQIVG